MTEPSANAPASQIAPDAGSCDLFLSYNSRDRAAVVRVRQLLHERNFTTFFDRDQLSAGSRWVSLLEGEVGSSRAVAVFIGPHGLGDWQEMEMQLALVRQIDEKKAGRQFPVIPLILPGATPDKELGFLKLYTWVDLRTRLDDPAAIDELERAVRGNASAQMVEAAVELCPYRALQAFREQDEKLFFGRDRFAEQLLAKARNEKLKLIAVVGPSGSGKSSVVQAGLLPRLRRERPPHLSWEAAIFTPGKAPFHNLAAALVTVGTAETDRWERLGKAEKLGQDLADGAVRFEAAMATALAEAPGANRLLLIVDQAEELFTLTTEQDRKPFIQRLLAAADAAPVTVMLTLRADFYGQAIGFGHGLGELITQEQVTILPMSRDELRQAIVAPADSVELKFEDGLVDRILDHVEDQPGNLPLLEFALTELWNRRQGKLLSNDAYRELGGKDSDGKELSGVEGAISRRAEEQFNRLSHAQQETAQRVLTRLVRVAAATEEGTDTRQRVRLSELDASAREVVRTFADARLLVTNRIEIKDEETGTVESEEIVEVAHEALIRSWQRLKDLLNRDRQFLLWRQRLGVALSEWERTGHDAGALLRGVKLNEARRWRKERGQDLNEREQEFITRSESAERRPKYWIAAAAALVIVSALAAVGWRLWENRPQSQINKILAQSPGLVKAAATQKENLPTVAIWLQTLALTGRSNKMLDAAHKIEDAGIRSLALVNIINALARAGKTEEMKRATNEALDAARKIDEYADVRSRTLASIVAALAEADKPEEALDAAHKIEGADIDDQVLASIVAALAKADKPEEALDTAHKIEYESYRSAALVSVVAALAKAGRIEESKRVANEALNATLKIGDAYTHSLALDSVVEALVKAGKTEEALDAARKIEDPYFLSLALANIINALAKAGKIEESKRATNEALNAARKSEDEDTRSLALDRVPALVGVIEALAKTGKTEEALDAARKIENAFTRSWALVSVARVLATGSWTADKARNVIEAAQQAAQQITNDADKSKAFANVAKGLAQLHLYRQARELVDQNNTSSSDKLKAYAAILREYAIEREHVPAELFEEQKPE